VCNFCVYLLFTRNSSQGYGALTAIWDHTALLVTQKRWAGLTLSQPSKLVII